MSVLCLSVSIWVQICEGVSCECFISGNVLRLCGYDSECVYWYVSVLVEFIYVSLAMHVYVYMCVCEGVCLSV